MVNYRRPGRFGTVSFAQVLAGEVPAADFEGKVVLIGGSAAGVGDKFATPFSPFMPGVERHATVIDDVLRQDFVVRRDVTALLDLGFVVLGGLLIGWLGQRGRLLGPSLGLGAILAAVLATNLLAFFERGLWLNLFLPLMAAVAIYTVVILYKYFIGDRQERRIRAAFKHYLSPTLVEQVARDPALLQLGGEQKELTVLFADVRDFDPARREAAAGGVRRAPQRGHGDHDARAVRARRHARQVHRRRAGGGVRRAFAPAGSCAARVSRRARDAGRADAAAGEMVTPRPAAARDRHRHQHRIDDHRQHGLEGALQPTR